MKQNKPFSGSLSLVKAFMFVSVLSLCGLSASAQTPARVGITDFSEVSNYYTEKVYDGTLALPMPTSSTITLTGVAAGDTVEAVAVGNYLSSNVGDNIPFTITFSLTGPQAANYYIDTIFNGSNGRITQKRLSISNTRVIASKIYDGNTDCAVVLSSFPTGVVTGDTVTVSAAGIYNDANVGGSKPVTVVYSVNGIDANNYLPPHTDSIHFFADITPKPIHINSTAIDTSKIYDGNTFAQIVNNGVTITAEIIYGDTVMPVIATANYLDKNVGDDKSVVVTYALNGPQASNYTALPDSTLVADILPRALIMEGAEVRLCKEYDGNTDATLLQAAQPTNVVDGDVVDVATTAAYDTPDTGHNKPIYLYYAFTGNGLDDANYTLPVREGYSVRGKIILPTQLAVLSTESGEFMLTGEGMCQGDAAEANYSVSQGEPVRYSLSFSAEALAAGFTNVDNVALSGIGEGTYLTIPVPAAAPFGHYTVDITFTNDAEVSVVYTFPFTVNYSTDYMTDIFSDVISIVNVEEIFTSYQWYHNGTAIEGANKPYYQEEGGLTGTYYVRVNAGETTEGRTCELAFNNAASKTVTVSPNPVVTTAKVSLKGFGEGEHVLQLFNAYGQQLLSTAFSGNECQIDLSAMPQGTYLVTVDGEKAKALKF